MNNFQYYLALLKKIISGKEFMAFVPVSRVNLPFFSPHGLMVFEMIDSEIGSKIQRLKDELGEQLCIMGHHYQSDEIAQYCDIMGDSLELARKIASINAQNIVFCGVYFMGETAALLAKARQQVYMPEQDADCMMAKMAPAAMARSVLKTLNANSGRIIPLAYVNTSLELKEVVGEFGGAVCTSANASQLLEWALSQGDGVLFLPDRNLGRNTAKKLGLAESELREIRLDGNGLRELPERSKLYLWPGCCAVHGKFTLTDIKNLKRQHPDAILLAHPECRPEVISQCDNAGSTSFLIKEIKKMSAESPDSKILIGTEENLVNRLAKQYEKVLSIKPFGSAICKHMAATTPEKLLQCLAGIREGQAIPIKIPQKMAANARLVIEKMLEVAT